MTCLAFLILIFREMNSEEEGRDRSARVGSLARSTTEIGGLEGGIFSKIHYGNWGARGWDLWQDLLRGLEGLEGGIFGNIHYGDWRDWRVRSLARSTTGEALFVIYDWFWYSA